MRRIAWCPGILLLASWAVQSATPAEPLSVEFGAGAWVDVDATGKAHVVEVEPLLRFDDDGTPGTLADTIKTRLRERIETWEFTPPMKDGVPVSGKTHLFVSATAADDGSGGMRILVKSASTGFYVKNHSLSPLFTHPTNLSEGWLNLHIEFGPDGKVTDASVVDAKGFGGRRFGGKIDRNTQRAVLATVKGFTAEMEWVDGRPIGGSGNLPIKICMSKACMSAQLPGTDGDSEGLVAAVSAMQLRTAVAGTVL